MLATLSRPFRPRTLFLLAVGFIVGMAALFLTASAAFAQEGDASPDAPVGTVFTINNSLVLLLTGLVVPLVNGLLNHPANPAWIKIGLAGALAAVGNAFIQAIQADGTAVLSQEWILQTVIVFATAIGTYLGVWDPLFRQRGGLNAATGPGIVRAPEPPPPLPPA